MTKAIQRLSKKDYDKAQFLYFSDREIPEICTVLSADPETIRFFIFGEDGEGTDPTSWFAIKRKMKPNAMALYLRDKISVLEQTAGLALEIVNGSLGKIRDAVNSNEMVLSVDDISKLAKVAVDMDKMYRLESGVATDIIDHMGLSIAEAKEILANDPFAQAVEAECVMLPWLDEVKSE